MTTSRSDASGKEQVSVNWTVYILRCGDGTLYTGIAIDVKARLEAREGGLIHTEPAPSSSGVPGASR